MDDSCYCMGHMHIKIHKVPKEQRLDWFSNPPWINREDVCGEKWSFSVEPEVTHRL
jgi:hypothetical protein